MSARFPAPIGEDVRQLLQDVLGRGVAVEKADAFEPDAATAGAVGAFATEGGEVGAVCLLDAAFVVRAAAALAMLPAERASEDVEAGELDAHLEMAGEIVSLMTRLFESPRAPELHLADVHRLPGEVPGPVADLVASPAFRRDFSVAIEGYGSGLLSILVA